MQPHEECRYCKGTARILVNLGPEPEYIECTSCNGTGIDGEPIYALFGLVVAAILFGGLVLWLVFG